MAGWADDPELVATFRAEVDERLASLCAGLMRLEAQPSSRQLIAGLFRDAHTVKGSARMLGLEGVVGVAHRCEDLLGALRDGRVPVRKDLVDLLLTSSEAISRSMPGADRPLVGGDLDGVLSALDRAVAGESPIALPTVGSVEHVENSAEPPRPRSGDSIRVPTRRVHDLLDVVGEAELDVRRMVRPSRDLATLAVEQQRWTQAVRRHASGVELPAELAEAMPALIALGDQLLAASRDLTGRLEDTQSRLARVRVHAMGLAMVPLRRVVAAFPQLVREVASAGSKDVVLELSGEDVELDSRVLDAVADALRHLVTNAVDHGCEPPAERALAGKAGKATVRVAARSAGSTVVVQVSDDGAGIDEDRLRAAAVEQGLLPEGATTSGPPLLALLFTAGFSTRDVVSATSGRGVGLDVVRTVVEELGGTIEMTTEAGLGTTFTMSLPVSLGVLRCLIARVGTERYALPVAGVVETVSLADTELHHVAAAPVIARHGQHVPLVDLGTAVGTQGDRDPRAAVVVRYGGTGELLAFSVDALETELEVVVKELGGFLGRLPTVAGATIDGDGSVLLVLDVRELAVRQFASGTSAPIPTRRVEEPTTPVPQGARPTVLVVEDSVGVRELQRVILEGAGYDVLTAVDGLDGAGRLTGEPPDLVLSDVEMPGMDGFTLTRTIRRTPRWADVPVVIMTSRGDAADQRAGLDAGASAYLLKSEFDQHELIDTVRRLVGR